MIKNNRGGAVRTKTEYALYVDRAYGGESQTFYPTLNQAMDAEVRAEEDPNTSRTWVTQLTWELRGATHVLIDEVEV